MRVTQAAALNGSNPIGRCDFTPILFAIYQTNTVNVQEYQVLTKEEDPFSPLRSNQIRNFII